MRHIMSATDLGHVQTALQNYLQKLLRIRELYKIVLKFINFSSESDVLELCPQSMSFGSCEFEGVEPSTNDFIVSWKLHAKNEKVVMEKRVIKSYEEFRHLFESLQQTTLTVMPELPKKRTVYEERTEQDIFDDMHDYLTKIMSRSDVVNLLSFIRFIASEKSEASSSENDDNERSLSLASNDSRTKSFADGADFFSKIGDQLSPARKMKSNAAIFD